MKKRNVVNISLVALFSIMLFSWVLFACSELLSGGNKVTEQSNKTFTTSTGMDTAFPDSFSKVLYDAVQNEQVPADVMIDGDKSALARIIFDGLDANEYDALSVIHVDDNGDDDKDGSTWKKAKRTIKDVLDDITDASANKLYLVLIGSGTYEITATLTMQNYVAIIGGFDASSNERSGYERSKATSISGGDSVQVFNNTSLDTSTKSTAVLAGVTVTKGKSTDGGGMYNYESSPTITHTTFSYNQSSKDGGGMYNYESSPTITHTTFSGNTATQNGGGMYNRFTSSPIISSSIFWGNTKGNSKTLEQIVNDTRSKPEIAHSIVQGGYGVDDSTNNIIDQDPLLDTLKNNGGFVETIAITATAEIATHPAINKGLYVARKSTTYYYSKDKKDWFTSPTLSDATKEVNFPADATRYTTDARGYTYNGRPDIGAYEYEGTAP